MWNFEWWNREILQKQRLGNEKGLRSLSLPDIGWHGLGPSTLVIMMVERYEWTCLRIFSRKTHILKRTLSLLSFKDSQKHEHKINGQKDPWFLKVLFIKKPYKLNPPIISYNTVISLSCSLEKHKYPSSDKYVSPYF